MAVGDIIKETLMVVEPVTIATDEDIERGEVIYDGGSGFLAAPNTVTASKLYVALESHDYSAESTHVIRALLIGLVNVQKLAGTAIRKGDLVMISSTDGAVTLYVIGDAPAGGVSTYYTATIEAGVQAAIDDYEIVLGTANETVLAAATDIDVWVGVK